MCVEVIVCNISVVFWHIEDSTKHFEWVLLFRDLWSKSMTQVFKHVIVPKEQSLRNKT